MSKHIRKAKPEDAQGIHEAHMRSIREVCSKDHSSEEIQGWGNRPFREQDRINAINNHWVWVIDISGKIEGFGHFSLITKDENLYGHIMGLYLAPEALGKGYGVKIVQMMIAEAKEKNVKEINLESTLTALRFYQKMGFKKSGDQGTIELGGSKVRYIPMKMII